jgi:hypothetical protein
LKINSDDARDDQWRQQVDYTQGRVVSRLEHGNIIEETRSLVCLTTNVLVFHTTLENQSSQAARIEFSATYELNTTLDSHLFFPFLSHFDFHPGYEQRVSEEVTSQIKTRVQAMPDENSPRVRYQINEQLGEVRLGWSFPAAIRETNEGGMMTFAGELNPGRRIELWLWVMLSDRQKFTHFPDYNRVHELVEDHLRGWADFWNTGYQGASFPWEALEDGQEGGPYGHWMDERFHIGQFAVAAWQYYLYTRDADDLGQFYPLMRGCAERFVHDVLVRDRAGRLATRLVTDFDEAVFPLVNGIFTICAAVRSLEIAAQAAEILGVEASKRDQWRHLASELREALPIHHAEQYYKVSDDRNHWHIAQVGMIYPFSVDVHSELARETLTRLAATLSTDVATTAGSPSGYAGSHWLWTTALIVTAYIYQGRSEAAFELLKKAPNCVGPFFAPNEQKIVRKSRTHYQLPWFTTSAGAFVYALNALLVYVTEAGTILFHGVPETLQALHFSGLSASHRVKLSGQIERGRIRSLRVRTEKALHWTAFIPARMVTQASFTSVCSVTASDQPGLHRLTCDLNVGETELIAQ